LVEIGTHWIYKQENGTDITIRNSKQLPAIVPSPDTTYKKAPMKVTVIEI